MSPSTRVGLLFAVIRQIARQDRLVRQGIWDRYAAWPDWHLHGQTLGLVGFGRIARPGRQKSLGSGIARPRQRRGGPGRRAWPSRGSRK